MEPGHGARRWGLWLMTATLSRWVGHPECMGRLPRLNGSKDGYIEGPKFPHLVDRQRKQFSLYQPINLDPTHFMLLNLFFLLSFDLSTSSISVKRTTFRVVAICRSFFSFVVRFVHIINLNEANNISCCCYLQIFLFFCRSICLHHKSQWSEQHFVLLLSADLSFLLSFDLSTSSISVKRTAFRVVVICRSFFSFVVRFVYIAFSRNFSIRHSSVPPRFLALKNHINQRLGIS
jgi:hypothetical protein